MFTLKDILHNKLLPSRASFLDEVIGDFRVSGGGGWEESDGHCDARLFSSAETIAAAEEIVDRQRESAVKAVVVRNTFGPAALVMEKAVSLCGRTKSNYFARLDFLVTVMHSAMSVSFHRTSQLNCNGVFLQVFHVDAFKGHIGNAGAAVQVGAAGCWSAELTGSVDAKVHIRAVRVKSAVSFKSAEDFRGVDRGAQLEEGVAGQSSSAVPVMFAIASPNHLLLNDFREKLDDRRINECIVIVSGALSSRKSNSEVFRGADRTGKLRGECSCVENL